MRWVLLATSSLVACSACFTTKSVEKPDAPLPVTAGKFPHDVLDGILKKHVNDKGQVDYKALKADRKDLERYLFAVQSYSPHSNADLFASDAHKLAYWINAYNAYVLYAITERPQLRSVLDDKNDFFYFTKYKFGAEEWSLYKLENEVVRVEFKEPRIHMALNCASGGCPELPAEAFMPDTLESQLAHEAKEFCMHPDKVRVKGDMVEVSQIFEFYPDDFEPGGPVKFCVGVGVDALPADAKWTFIPYDWGLNAQPGTALYE